MRKKIVFLICLALSFYFPKQLFAEGERIRLLTYNIHLGLDGATERVLADYIKAKKIDIVGIQESSGDSNKFQELLNHLSSIGYPMHGRHVYRRRYGAIGDIYQVVLSRYPIREYEVFNFSEGSKLQTFRIEINSKSIRFFNYHPLPHLNVSTLINELVPKLREYESETVFVLGDFNLDAIDPRFKIEGYTDGYQVALKMTSSRYTTIQKTGKIDHIMFKNRPPFNFVPLEVIIDHGFEKSDHYPVIGEFYNGTPPVSAIQWDFLPDGNTEGWWLWDESSSTNNLSSRNGILNFDITGTDPYVFSPKDFSFYVNENQTIKIRMKISKGGTQLGYIYWYKGVNFYLTAFTVFADNRWHEYSIPVGRDSNWRGMVNFWRIDPITRNSAIGAKVEIDWIRILPYLETPTPTPRPTSTPRPTAINTPRPTNTSTPIRFCSSCSPGDADCDGKVDLIDFSLWLEVYQKILNSQFVSQSDKTKVDFNCQEQDKPNHTVDLIDFDIWLESYRKVDRQEIIRGKAF